MSLSDELRYLRALHGGPPNDEVEAAADIPRGMLWQLEKKYRRVGEDDEVLARLAAYYGVPLEELQFHRERYRKAFSVYLHQAEQSGQIASFHLRTGEKIDGQVRWWDMAAFGLEMEGQELTVVQRHAVVDWGGSE
jgi:transcriptional regulator with XRE-family HTH domain